MSGERGAKAAGPSTECPSRSRSASTSPGARPRSASRRGAVASRSATPRWSRRCARRARSSWGAPTCRRRCSTWRRATRCSARPRTHGRSGTPRAAPPEARGPRSRAAPPRSGWGRTSAAASARPPTSAGSRASSPALDRLPMKGYRTVLAGQETVRGMGGPMARTVADLALFFRALDPRRLAALDPRVPPLAWEAPAGVKLEGLRVGFYTDDGVLPASHALARAVERAAAALRSRGATTVAVRAPRRARAHRRTTSVRSAPTAGRGSSRPSQGARSIP